MKIILKVVLLPLTSICSLLANDSITANYGGYLAIAQEASENSSVFEKFRTFPEYRCALEIDDGETFAQYIRFKLSKLGPFLEECRKLDNIGGPPLTNYQDLGFFSPTTLRYIFHADQILKYFNLPDNATIVEIGAGFGGQAHVLQKFHSCVKYYIYDLPQVEALISTMMNRLNWKNVCCLQLNESLPEERVDLLISNYAYSECDREMQLGYFDRVIKKADRGYMIYNQIAAGYGIDSLSISEFIDLLKKNGFRPRVYKEFFAGAGNSLILWDKSK